METVKVLELQNKTQDRLNDAIDFCQQWIQLRDTVSELERFISLVETDGLSRSIVALVAADPKMMTIFKKVEIDHMFDVAKFDYTFSKNTMTSKIVSVLKEHLTSQQDIKEHCYAEVKNIFADAQTSFNECIVGMRKVLLQQREELSNSSKEGIPSRMAQETIVTYPVDDNMNLMFDKPSVALTMGEVKHTRDSVIKNISEMIKSTVSVTKDEVFLSDKPEELLETLNEYRKLSRDTCVQIASVLSLCASFRSCC